MGKVMMGYFSMSKPTLSFVCLTIVPNKHYWCQINLQEMFISLTKLPKPLWGDAKWNETLDCFTQHFRFFSWQIKEIMKKHLSFSPPWRWLNVSLSLSLMNRLSKTKSAVFKLWMLYFQRIFFTDYLNLPRFINPIFKMGWWINSM